MNADGRQIWISKAGSLKRYTDEKGFRVNKMEAQTTATEAEKMQKAIETEPKKWVITDWPDLTNMNVFRD